MISRKMLANAIRILSIDAVEKAKSGHPGMPMGMADIAETLWRDFLKHNPLNPSWINRDRFVLSNGHGSMLLYSLLHLTGYPSMTLEQLKNFRQLHSLTPGHPEHGITPGVEVTTGPLGQGFASAVGMALAEKILAAQFNRPNFDIINHYTYVFLGDGCLMEGISHESASLAGHHKLGKLIAFWDDNGISIDGEVKNWFTDDTPKRFQAYGWHVVENINGHDHDAVQKAIIAAQEVTDRPSLICCKTVIGYGSPNLAGTADTHGSPLGAQEIELVRQQLNWSYPPFEIPETVYQGFDACEKGQLAEQQWQNLFNQYQSHYPELAVEFNRRVQGQLPENLTQYYAALKENFLQNSTAMATRKASAICLNYLAPELPELVGGSADLTGSNLTDWSGMTAFSTEHQNGNYIYFGVREFGMFAAMNGFALHGGFIPYGGTFLVFCDYGRNAIRLAALMKLRAIYILTHDSIGLGEDGPTHQPIEHAAMLRLTPNLSVWRPADAFETAIAWFYALQQKNKPTALLLSRQNLTIQPRDEEPQSQVEKGGYILKHEQTSLEAIIIATGSEVELAIKVWEALSQKGIVSVRVVSMPSTDVFDKQETAYQEKVLPKHIRKRIAIEAGARDYWYRYVGIDGKIFGLSSFGESAPAKDVFNHFGLTVDNIVREIEAYL